MLINHTTREKIRNPATGTSLMKLVQVGTFIGWNFVEHAIDICDEDQGGGCEQYVEYDHVGTLLTQSSAKRSRS